MVVDNASTDASADILGAKFPNIDLRVLETNLGFAGNNAALLDLDDVDYVGLINNDAFATPGYLGPLVEALEADPSLGAVCPKILLEAQFVAFDIDVVIEDGQRVTLQRVEASNPSGGDGAPSPKGDQGGASGSDGSDGSEAAKGGDITARCHMGASSETRNATETGTTWFELVDHARLWVPDLARGEQNQVTLTFAGGPGAKIVVSTESTESTQSTQSTESRQSAEGESPNEPVQATLGPDGRATVTVSTSAAAVDVIQNIGTNLVAAGFGQDRGYLEADTGQYDTPEEVFGWCGAGVLFRPEYLETVGLFDERYFLYYEDLDLSWRGRNQGWRYRTVPDAVLRHAHASSTVQGSPSFTRYQVRNRLILLAKNGSPALASRTMSRSLAGTLARVPEAIRGGAEARQALRARAAAQLEALRMAREIRYDRRDLEAVRTTDANDVEKLIR